MLRTLLYTRKFDSQLQISLHMHSDLIAGCDIALDGSANKENVIENPTM